MIYLCNENTNVKQYRDLISDQYEIHKWYIFWMDLSRTYFDAWYRILEIPMRKIYTYIDYPI